MTSPEVLKQLGNEAFAKREFKKAAKIYRDAISLDGENPILLSNRAMCFIKLNDWERAKRDCERAFELKCDNKTKEKLYYRYGITMKNLNHTREAIESFKHALEINAQNEPAKKEIKVMEQGNYEKTFRAARSQTRDMVDVPIYETDVLPDNFLRLAKGEDIKEKMEVDEKDSPKDSLKGSQQKEYATKNVPLRFGELPTMQHLASLHSVPDSQKENAYRFVIESDGSLYQDIFSETGVDPQFMEFFIEASAYVSSKKYINNWAELILRHLNKLSGFKRFHLSLLMCSNKTMNTLLNNIEIVDDTRIREGIKKALNTD